MFFDDIKEISTIALSSSCAVFVVPKEFDVALDGAIVLEPTSKTIITIEQVREVLGRLSLRQTRDVFVLVRPADALGEEASNALLKSFEEPQEKIHFVLVTDSPSRLLDTILSRSAIYFLRQKVDVDGEIKADAKQIEIAKKLIVAKNTDLVGIANELTKKKDGVRSQVLAILGVAIEMLYKSYFRTHKDIFIVKLPKFLACYEAIMRNGHIKLHLVADLI